MISVEGIKKKFGATIAVDIENLIITEGEIFGLVGNNGAGKTTFLRLMLDLIKADRGQIFSKGKPVYQSEHWKRYTGSFIDDNFLIEFLTPDEYFNFIGFVYGVVPDVLKKRIDGFRKFMNGEILGSRKYIRNLSSGNKQKVGIIGALISDPEILILDEPFNFLDPSSQIILKHILKRDYEGKRKTIILSSHNLNHISDLCSRISLMEKGKIIKDCNNNSESIKEIEVYFESQIGIF